MRTLIVNQYLSKKLWTPAEMTTALWLDATDSSTITESGGAVSQWDDKSGNGRNVSQSTPTLQPTYSNANINGVQAILFDSDSLVNTAVGLPTSAASARSMFVVYRPTKTGINGLCGQGFAASNGSWFVLQSRDFLGDPFFAGYVPYSVGGGPGTVTFTPKIAEIIYDGTSGTLFGTGNQYNTENLTLNTSGDRFTVGSSPGGSEPHGGEIGEVIFVSSAVSSIIREKIEGYLAHKWGLTANLPVNHPYKTTPPYV